MNPCGPVNDWCYLYLIISFAENLGLLEVYIYIKRSIFRQKKKTSVNVSTALLEHVCKIFRHASLKGCVGLPTHDKKIVDLSLNQPVSTSDVFLPLLFISGVPVCLFPDLFFCVIVYFFRFYFGVLLSFLLLPFFCCRCWRLSLTLATRTVSGSLTLPNG